MSVSTPTVTRALTAATLFLVLAPIVRGAGWGFVPTARDWEAWPQYCRVQYSYINRGANEYGDYYPDSAINKWRSIIGEKTFTALHHYCKARIILEQMKLESNPKIKSYLVGVALDDGQFSYVRSDPQSIVYPSVASVMARAKFANGDVDEAIAILKGAIEAQPQRFDAYSTLAYIYREQKNLELALKTVNQANDATKGESAEIQYNLGLLNLEAGNVDAAVLNARASYAAGYPLAGLRTKLERLGRWPEKNANGLPQENQ